MEGKITKISLDYYNLRFNKIISVEMVNNETCSIAFSVFPSPIICWNSLQFVPPGDTGSRLHSVVP